MLVTKSCPGDMSKASLLLNRSTLRWHNQTTSENRERYVQDLERWFETASGPEEFKSILRSTVAALSPPKGIVKSEIDGVEFGGDDQHALDAGLQKRLRKLALSCLQCLDLSDCTLLPILERLKHLIVLFEAISKSRLEVTVVACSNQWRKLKERIGEVQNKLQLMERDGKDNQPACQSDGFGERFGGGTSFLCNSRAKLQIKIGS